MTYPHSADRPTPDNPQPLVLSRAVRIAIAAGPLTAEVLARHQREAAQQGKHLLEVLSEADRLHLHVIQRTLPPGSTWTDVVEAIRTNRPPA